MFESGRRSFWKNTPGYAENQRLTFKLSESNNTIYNEFWYSNIIQDKNNYSYNSLPSVIEDSYDYGYTEESYVDNSEAFSDTFPKGYRTELGGFYINTGKLKLIPLFSTATEEKKIVKKKFPSLKNMIKKPRRDTKQRSLLKELKKMKFPLILKGTKYALESLKKEDAVGNTSNSSLMIPEASKTAETKKYSELNLS